MTTETKKETPKPKKKRRLWLKIPLYFLLFIIIVLALLPFYSSFFIPTITQIIEKQTGRKAHIDALSINLFGASVHLDNFQLKEKELDKNFVKIQKVDIDLSVFSLLFGKINIVNAEIAGVHLNVAKNAKGKFNYQSILDHLPKPKKSNKDLVDQKDKPSEPSEEPKSLPSLSAKVILSDVNFHFDDVQKDTHLNMKNLNFICNVADLSKISYQSNWENAKFESRQGKETSAGLIYQLSGNLGIAIKKGKWSLFSKGDFNLSDIYAKGFGKKDITDSAFKFNHDLAIDLEQGTCEVNNVLINSDYVKVSISNLKIDNLDKIQEKLPELLLNKNMDQLKEFFMQLPINAWGGKITATLDLDQIKADFGDSIISTINKALKPKKGHEFDQKGNKKVFYQFHDFTGKAKLEITLDGQEKIFNIKENFNFNGLTFSGKDSNDKVFNVNLKKISQDFSIAFNFQQENIDTSFNFNIFPTEKEKLLEVTFKSSLNNIFDREKIEIPKSKETFFLDFDVLHNTFSSFIPKETQLKGKVSNSDWISYSAEKGIIIGGETNLYAKIISKETKDLPPLIIKGQRLFHLDMNEQKKLQKIAIKKLNIGSGKSKIFTLSGKGSINLEGDNNEGLKIKLISNLEKLQPYIKAFQKDISIKGTIKHETTLKQKGEKIRLFANGNITSLSLLMKDSFYNINKASWGCDIIATMKDKFPKKIDIKSIFFKHKSISLSVHAAIDKIQQKPFKFALAKLKIKKQDKISIIDGIDLTINANLEKIPSFVKEIAEKSGINLQRLSGILFFNTKIKGNLNAIKIANKISYKGNSQIRFIQEDGSYSESISLKQGIKSAIALEIKNADVFLDKKGSVNIHIDKRSYFNLQNNSNPLLSINLSGDITKEEENLNLDNLEIKVKGYGKSIQESIPVNFIAKNNPDLQNTLSKALKMGGFFTISVGLNGSPENIIVKFKTNLTPFLVRYTDPKKGKFLDKNKSFPLEYSTEISYKDSNNEKTIQIVNSNPKLGNAKISMDDMAIIMSKKDGLHLTGLDGSSAVKIIEIENLHFSELSKMLPIIEQLKLQNADMKLSLSDVIVHEKTEDMSGKLFGRINIPEIDLPHIQKVLGSGEKKNSPEEQPEKQDENSSKKEDDPENAELITLSEKVRNMLKKFAVDFKILVKKAKIDDGNHAEDFSVTAMLNEKEPNNKFLLDINGKTNTGKLKITAKADLNQEHPKCNFNSDIQDVPYVASLFSPVSKSLNDIMPFPLFKKINFGQGEAIKFSFKGDNSWTGLDPRVIKKSLLSGESVSFKISGGKFDLGFDMNEFLDLDAAKKELEATLAPLKNQITQIQSNILGSNNSVDSLSTSLKSIEKKIDPIINKKREIEGWINKLSGVPFVGSKVKKYKSTLSVYDKQITEYEQQKTSLQGKITVVQEKINSFKNTINDLQKKIKEQQKNLLSKLKIENPFSFDFGSLFIAFKVTNTSPYSGSSSNWSSHPFSKINYAEISFTPTGKPFPTLKGWCTLDGNFNFNFLPATEYMENIKKNAPALANLIDSKNGISWGSKGFNTSEKK